MESLNTSQVQHRYHSNDAMIDLELDMLLEYKELQHIEYLILSAQSHSGVGLSEREAMRLALLEKQFGEARSGVAQKGHIAEVLTDAERFFLQLYQMYGDDLPGICPVAIPPRYLHLFPPHTPTHITPLNTHTDTPTQKTKNGRARPAPEAPNYSRKPWRKQTRAERLQYAFNIMQNFSGQAFTLNLNEREEKTLLDSPDPVRVLSDRINRALKAEGLSGAPYMMVLEVSPEGRLHAHGAILPPRGTDLKTVNTALRKAGGRIRGKGAARQACLRSIFHADGWDKYLRKAQKKTKRVLGLEKITFISQPLIRLCNDIQEEHRNSVIH